MLQNKITIPHANYPFHNEIFRTLVCAPMDARMFWFVKSDSGDIIGISEEEKIKSRFVI